MIKFFKEQQLLLIAILFTVISCSRSNSESTYFFDLGEIPFDPLLDDKEFNKCHEDITLTFNYGGNGLVYKGEKKELTTFFFNKYSYPKTKGETGFVSIRFIINCEGKSGRYRVSEMNLDLEKKKFDRKIINQLLNITKNLDGWKPLFRGKKAWDYHQYLTFKIVNGELKKILP